MLKIQILKKKSLRWTALIAAALTAVSIGLSAKTSTVAAASTAAAKSTTVSGSQEKPLSGTAVVIYPGPGFVHLMSANGSYNTGTIYDRYIGEGTTWKVYAEKTIDGQLAYRIGTEHQWIFAKYVTLKTPSTTPAKTPVKPSTPAKSTTPAVKSEETPLSGTAVVIYPGPGFVHLMSANGSYNTGTIYDRYIGEGTTWKVYAEKTIDGQLAYRIGTEHQWIFAKYVTLKTPSTTPAKTPTTPSKPATPTKPTTPTEQGTIVPVEGVTATVTYTGKGKVALLDGNGDYTKQYVAPETTWKVFAKKTLSNGKVFYKLGSDQQWIPAQYVSVH